MYEQTRPAVPSSSSSTSSSSRRGAHLGARVCTALAERPSVPGPYIRRIMAGERARDVPTTTYLRDRESARTLPVICGPYQMRPRSFHCALRSAQYVTLSFASLLPLLPPVPSPSASRRPATEQKSFPLPLRPSRIMYPQADPFSIDGIYNPDRIGKPSCEHLANVSIFRWEKVKIIQSVFLY